MSARTRERFTRQVGRLSGRVGTRHVIRAAALLAALVLISSFTLVLAEIVSTVGDPRRLWLVVAGTGVVATALWPVVSTRQALRVGGVALVLGMAYYALAVPFGLRIGATLRGTAELLTGRSALWIVRVELWALLAAPGPVFVTWVLALKRQYVWAAAVGGSMLCFLVLTGDADLSLTLLGVVAAGGLVGLGDVEFRAYSLATAEYLAVVLAIMVVAPFLFSVVPGGSAGPLALVGDGPTTMEENVVESGTNLEIAGSVSQDPAVRFVVSGGEPRYWRTGSYDRFTGTGWIQTGDSGEGTLQRPEQVSEVATYEVSVQTTLGSLPVPWRPVGIEGQTDRTRVAPDGAITLDGSLESGDSYTVTSAIPEQSPSDLADADAAYPDELAQQYTQLPSDTPARVAERTRNIAVNATTPFETATVVAEWLRTNRGYSLDVDRPEGNIVDAFLFEMDAGYCTYYATAMAGMLRSVDIPARLAVGYTSGDQIAADTRAVRGADSHAWVEAYIPGHGWISFDPTPSDPRADAETGAVGVSADPGIDVDTDSRSADGDGSGGTDRSDPVVEINETQGSGAGVNPTVDELDPASGVPGDSLDPSENDTAGPNNLSGPDGEELREEGPDQTDKNKTDTGGGPVVSPGDVESVDPDGALLELPAYQQLLLGALAVAGLAVSVRRSRLSHVLYRAVRVRFQRRRNPETDIERAHERMMLVLEQRHRPRDPGETTRQYLDAVEAGPDARRLAAIRERTRHAGEYDSDDADEAVELVDAVRTD